MGPGGDDSTCGLCAAREPGPFAPSPERHVDCASCGLVALRRSLHLSPAAERARYELHRNSPGDAGYRAFLERLATPLAARLPRGAAGLDFGCGPGPALPAMLEERGLACSRHDPVFEPNPAALTRTWDFVACTEVVEHLREPRAAWVQLAALVRPGGLLGIMTQPLTPEREARFADWAYARDPTHVALYRPRTLEGIASRHGFELECVGDGAWILARPGVNARS